MNKKIVVASCKRCPFRSDTGLPIVINGIMIYDVCGYDDDTRSINISTEIITGKISPKCPLEDDYHISVQE